MIKSSEQEAFFTPEKEAFFDRLEAEGTALTFDDVRLRTAPSEVSPKEVDTRSRFSRNVELKAPLVSAAMDTVTESKMAIAIAKLGGLGVIHAGLEPEVQRDHVRRVKLHLNALIERPVTVQETDTLGDVLRRCDEMAFDFRTFPVVDNEGRLSGLLTQNDFDFAEHTATQVSDAMTPRAEIMSAEAGTSIEEAYRTMIDHKKKTLPLLNEDGHVVGLYIFSDVRRIARDNSREYNVDGKGRLRVAAAVPTDDEAIERVGMMRQYLDVAVIDSAQGDSRYAFLTLEALKEDFPDLDVVVGNISSPKSARLLADAGADGIKVGQGPGSICTTRVETGIGTPQVSAVYNCKQAILASKKPDVPVCADGGIREAGDVSIAIASGADSVMMGGMLAGTNEAPSDVIELEDGSRVMVYRGMGSPSAIRDSAAARKRYGGGDPSAMVLAEGVESFVPIKGPVDDVVRRIVLALRKSMSYVGASDIKTHQAETQLYRITNAGMAESRPHDVTVVKAPYH